MKAIGRIALVTLLAAAVLSASPVWARVATLIEVYPGKHALQRAVASATPGDVLDLHAGTYRGAVVIETPSLTLMSAGDGRVTITGRCHADTLSIYAGGTGFTLQGPITLEGGSTDDVAITAAGGAISNVTLRNTCGTAEYGIDLYGTRPLSITGSRISGFAAAGIRLVDPATPQDHGQVIQRNEVFDNGRGIIVQGTGRNESALVSKNDVHDNDVAGILLTMSAWDDVRGNTVLDNGTYGIILDASSPGADRVISNVAHGQGFDLSNVNPGNCFKDNEYDTSEGRIGC